MLEPRTPQITFEYFDDSPSLPSHIPPLLSPEHARTLLQLRTSNIILERKISQLSTKSSESEASEFLKIRAEFISNADQEMKATLNALRHVFQDDHS